jgi:hypothetical protein
MNKFAYDVGAKLKGFLREQIAPGAPDGSSAAAASDIAVNATGRGAALGSALGGIGGIGTGALMHYLIAAENKRKMEDYLKSMAAVGSVGYVGGAGIGGLSGMEGSREGVRGAIRHLRG